MNKESNKTLIVTTLNEKLNLNIIKRLKSHVKNLYD